MLPGPAFWMVATPRMRAAPSPLTSPPQRAASSVSVYSAPMRASVAAGRALGLEVLLHLDQHLVGHIHRVVLVEDGIAGDHQVVLLGLGEFLHGLDDVLLQAAQHGVALHVHVVHVVALLAAEVA